MSNKIMYWNGNGAHQALYEKLNELIPAEGEVAEPRKNRALEKLRKAANCYYDLFNNGLGNRAAEFRQVFGFGGTSIAKTREFYSDRLERCMDEIILKAAHEQGLLTFWPFRV